MSSPTRNNLSVSIVFHSAQQKENLEKANDTVRKTELKLLTTTEELKLQERNHNDML